MSGSQPIAALFAGTLRLARTVVLSIRRPAKVFAAAILCVAFTWVGGRNGPGGANGAVSMERL
jgi:hypothetical protein